MEHSSAPQNRQVEGAQQRDDQTFDVALRPRSFDEFVGQRDQVANLKVFVDCIGLDLSASYELPVRVHLEQDTGVRASTEPTTVTLMSTESEGIGSVERPISLPGL